jgi:hypothetical protein
MNNNQEKIKIEERTEEMIEEMIEEMTEEKILEGEKILEDVILEEGMIIEETIEEMIEEMIDVQNLAGLTEDMDGVLLKEEIEIMEAEETMAEGEILVEETPSAEIEIMVEIEIMEVEIEIMEAEIMVEIETMAEIETLEETLVGTEGDLAETGIFIVLSK